MRALATLVGLTIRMQATGGTVDMAVETAWGDDLGRVIIDGAPCALAAETRSVEGVGRERDIYAPVDRLWHTQRKIGQRTEAAALVGWVADKPVHAPREGTLRGLTHDGVLCVDDMKIIEVDPARADKAPFWGLGERPRRIADGMISAIQPVIAAPLPRRVT